MAITCFISHLPIKNKAKANAFIIHTNNDTSKPLPIIIDGVINYNSNNYFIINESFSDCEYIKRLYKSITGKENNDIQAILNELIANKLQDLQVVFCYQSLYSMLITEPPLPNSIFNIKHEAYTWFEYMSEYNDQNILHQLKLKKYFDIFSDILVIRPMRSSILFDFALLDYNLNQLRIKWNGNIIFNNDPYEITFAHKQLSVFLNDIIISDYIMKTNKSELNAGSIDTNSLYLRIFKD